MSVNLGAASATAVKQFDTEVKQAFQALTSVLDGSYRARMGVVGDTYNFRRMTAGVAKQRNAPQTNVTPMDINYSLVPCTLTDWDASEYTDLFKQQEVNFSERQELAQCIAAAMARRKDQIVFDTLATGSSYTGAQTVAKTVGGSTGANFNVKKLLAAKQYFDVKNVPKQDRFCLMHANQAASLLTDPLFINRDYNAASTSQLENGDPKFYLGFRFIIIGDYDEGGIALRTADRYAYCWQKTGLGAAFANVQDTEVNYIPEKKSYLASGNLRMGATLIESVTGCLRIDNVDAATYNA